MPNNEVLIVLNYTIPAFISIIFMGFIIARIVYLQKVAERTQFKLNWSLGFRICLLCIDIGMEFYSMI